MSDRARSFGARAEAYERFRPGYPAELVGTVAAYAGRAPRTALEIGAGTGKATRLFAAHGVAVTATEPDGAMLAELRRRVPPHVRTVQAAFEDLAGPRDLPDPRPDAGGQGAEGSGEGGEGAGGTGDGGDGGEGAGGTGDGGGAVALTTYDLVYAAAALHWTSPHGRWARVAALLRPGGVFACFGGPVRLADSAVEEAVRTARAPFLDSDDVPSPDGTPPDHALQWPGTELRRSPWFTDVEQTVLPRHVTMTAADYLGHLSTISAYLLLPAPERRSAFRAIARVLPATVDLTADIHTHLARRVPTPHDRPGG